ncbi:MAG: YHS domain-containing (seleno)protein [Rhodospirillales bacterium]
MRKALIRLVAALPFLLLVAAPASAGPVFEDGGAAIRGYDAVAYFTENKPVEGDVAFAHDWNGATWLFSSAANRDAFAADPGRYAPQYGGYCAYAVSEGYTAPTDPAAWSIVDDRLFLNYSRSVQSRWSGNAQTRIRAGDANWPEIEAGL